MSTHWSSQTDHDLHSCSCKAFGSLEVAVQPTLHYTHAHPQRQHSLQSYSGFPDQWRVSPCRALAARSWRQPCAATSTRCAGLGQQQRGLSPGRCTCWDSCVDDRQQCQQCRRIPPYSVRHQRPPLGATLTEGSRTASPTMPHIAARLTSIVVSRNSVSQRCGGRKTAL